MRVILVAFSFCVVVGCSQEKLTFASKASISESNRIQNPIQLPPFSPNEDESVAEEKELSHDCVIETLNTFPKSIIDYSVVTVNRNRNYVWRANITAVNGRAGRIVCWRPIESSLAGVVINSKFLEADDNPLP